MHFYTTEQIQFLRENIAGKSYAEVTSLINEHFGLALTVEQIKGVLARYKLCNGRDGRFHPGQTPHNKGTKGIQMGGKETQFKPGAMPWNYKPVGTERTNTDGYVEIKVADPHSWKGKHLIVWEAEHGPVPAGHVVIFADGNRQNVTLDNLLLLSRRELAVMNKRGLISVKPELTKTGLAVANIYLKIGERKRRGK